MTKITRLNPNATARQLLAFLKECPQYAIKSIGGQAWIVRCTYVSATFPIIEHINHASLLAV